MNREIKFRAWSGKHMLEVGELTLFRQGHFLVNDEFPISPENLLQYTGLDDKHGKEIYEGDIVNYANKNWQVQWSNIDQRWDLFYEKSYHLHLCKRYKDQFEIIGNIYENPELLNSTE